MSGGAFAVERVNGTSVACAIYVADARNQCTEKSVHCFFDGVSPTTNLFRGSAETALATS